MLFVSCKEQREEDKEDTSAYDISIKDWPSKSKVNVKVDAIIAKWPEYGDLDTTFDGLYTVENTEDLSLIIADLVKNQKLLADSVYPESFDKPQIKSRQKVFHTFILKTKGDLEYRLDPQKSVAEMINAYNSMRNQFEIITNNTLDLKKLLEE